MERFGLRLIDSHCHLDDYADLDGVLGRARAAGVGTLLAIGIGDGPATMHRALDIARDRVGSAAGPGIVASVGIHPQEAAGAGTEALARLTELAGDPLCVAVGEIGLDYYHADNPPAEVQQAALVAQMAIAAAAGRPIVVHLRTSETARPEARARFGTADAWEDLLRLAGEHWRGPAARGGILHCFSGGAAEAERAVEAGFHLSFAGNVTYRRSTAIREAAAWCPAERLLVETDAPFLAPVPHRGETNEPARVVHTAAALAELRGVAVDEVAAVTTANFERLFPSARQLR